MSAHPFADRFPMLGAEELDRLAADIAENGLRNPVTFDSEGRILDGRNRWAACGIAGVTPETVVYEGDDLAAFVLSANVSRRHLTTGQQAMSTALVLTDAGKRENGRWKRGTVVAPDNDRSVVTDWARAMQRAGLILDHAPDLADDVVSGALALDAAFRQAEQVRDAERQNMAEIERMQAEEADARNRLVELAPAYMTALDNGEYKSARQAYTAWEDENRAEAIRERHRKADEEKRRKEHFDAHRDLYSGIVASIANLAHYNQRDSAELFEHFTADMLMPNETRAFTIERMRDAVTTLTGLIDWKSNAA